MVYSTQHVAWSFKGLTGNADTEHLSRRGDLHMCSGIILYSACGGLASVSTKIAAFS